MKCPTCSNEIPGSAKFCPECGAPLASIAGVSDSEADRATLLRKYIPPELAKRILSAGKQIESERRLVTVLFADVSGFTAMSEKLDAEEVSSVLNDCFKGLISIVYKYEGVIDKFIGDEIMAIFGAPLTHENDPERAVRCSMEMMEYMERFNTLSPVTLPEPLGLHISMNTGMVIAGNVGSDLRMNYSVIGDTVNLASRLKHIAERGEIVVSEDTFRIVSSLVNADEPRFVDIKGKSEPAKVYKILSLKGGIEPGIRVTQKNPIIGREQEIAVLQSALEKVLQKKEQRVFIRGEAGVGKTRLKLELIPYAKSSGITIYEGKCSSFEINTPYYLWTTLLKDILQLKADTIESETCKRLHDILQILSLEKDEPYLATLLSLRYEEILLEEDQERKRRIFESLKEFIRALSKRKPSAFLLEDVHWIDRFSQDMLKYLFTEEQLAPAMFVTLCRDEYIHSKELIEKGGTLIDLNRLTKPDAQRLMCARLNVEEVPPNLAELIYKRSEGNPFFIEELVKTLLDKNVVVVKKQKLEILKTDFESILPETVQGVIMARIDRLEEKLKEVLFGASVIGREFDKSLLNEILKKKETIDPSLHELLSLELILEKEEAKELAYLFKHYLIQEVAYNTILQKKRRELHKLIAQAIEKVYAEKLKDFYELLSFHFEKAEEWEKAADYLSRAGRKVGEAFSKDESNAFQERKEIAIQKLYESASEHRLGWIILQVLMGVVLVPVVAMLLIASYYVAYMVWVLPPHSEFIAFGSEILGSLIFYLYVLFLFLAFPWTGLVFIFFGIIPAMRGKPRLFDITEDAVHVLYRSGKSVSIPLSEIQNIWYFNPAIKKSRPFIYKILDPFYRMPEYSSFTIRLWFKEVFTNILPPFSFSFGSKEGEVQLMRYKGANRRRLLMPWLNSQKRARVISISPSNPKEFHIQLQTAIAKWNKLQPMSSNQSSHKIPSALSHSLLIFFLSGLTLLMLSCKTPPVIYDAELKGRQLDTLIQELTRKINANPTDASTMEELGLVYLQRANYQIKKTSERADAYWGTNRDTMKYFITEARRCYEKALQVRPNSATAYIGLGNCYRMMYQPIDWPFFPYGDDDRQIPELIAIARSYYKRATEIQPEMADAWFYLFLSARDDLNLSNINGEFATLADLDNQWDHLGEMLDKVLSIDRYHLKASSARIYSHRWHESNKNVLDNLNALYPLVKKNAEVDIDALEFCRNYTDFQADIYQKHIKNVPNFVKPFIWLPYQKLAYLSWSSESLKKSYEMEPYNSRLLSYGLGYRMESSQFLDYYREFIRMTDYVFPYEWYYYFHPHSLIQPKSYWVHLAYGLSYWEWKSGVGSSNADTSRVYFNRAIALDSSRAIGYYLLASLQYQTGETSKAEANLSLAAHIQPSDHFARVCANELLTLLYLKRGDLQKAMRTFETAMRIDSSYVQHSFTGGVFGWHDFPFYVDSINGLFNKTGKDEKAFLAWICLANGKTILSRHLSDSIPYYVKAYQWFKKAIKLDPQNINVYIALPRLFYAYPLSKENAMEFKKVIQKALQAYPSNKELWLDLAFITSRDYSGSEAFRYVEKAASLGSYYAKEILERSAIASK